MKLSKRVRSFENIVDLSKKHSIEDALSTIDKFPKVKFDETVEIHLSLNINPKNSDQMVRGTVVLPNGTGKNIKVAVFCKGELETKAKEIGADVVGSEELIAKVANGFLDFDVVIATPDMMKNLSKLGRILGPRGLMPTPKAGTVTMDIEKAIKDIKAGKIEFKSDKQAGIHIGVGKRSFDKNKLKENIEHILEAIYNVKPVAIKGALIKAASLSTTMGPGLRLSL